MKDGPILSNAGPRLSMEYLKQPTGVLQKKTQVPYTMPVATVCSNPNLTSTLGFKVTSFSPHASVLPLVKQE